MHNYIEKLKEAKEFAAMIVPYCERVAPTGLLRQKRPVVPEIAIIAIPKQSVRQGELFGGGVRVNELNLHLSSMVKSGVIEKTDKQGGYRFSKYNVRVKVIQATPETWEAVRFQSSCCSCVYITVACSAKALDLKWSPIGGGFVDRKTNELKIPITDERQIFDIAKIPYTPVDKRHFLVDNGEVIVPDKQIRMTQEEVENFINASVWVDTKSGGEWHQFAPRGFAKGMSEWDTVRFYEFIRKFGYDGIYHGMKWRYIDFGEYCYFTCGCNPRFETFVNRKLHHKEKLTPWKVNPEAWVNRKPGGGDIEVWPC